MNIAPGVTASRVGGERPNRRPGQVPPFAVFSQEKRGYLQELYPEYNFGELGRRLSEMWHALSEEDKELYRRKARLIGLQKLKAWDDKMKRNAAPYFIQQKAAGNPGVASAAGAPQQRAPSGSSGLQQQTASGSTNNTIKRRRTHGYAIFMSEERKKHSTLNVPLGDVTRKVAEAWRSLDPSVRATYESKANRINAIENRRYQQALLLQQRSAATAKAAPSSATPLRIASVESLSRPGVKPNVNLPSGITISRVEPEGGGSKASSSHSSNGGHLRMRPAPGSKSLIDMRLNGEGAGLIDMRAAGGGGRLTAHNNPKMPPRVPPHYPPPLQRRPPPLHNGGMMPLSYALPGSAGMPMKRGLPPGSVSPHLAPKRAKHIIPPRPPLMRQGGLKTSPLPSSIGILGTLDTWDKMCRLCGRTLIPIVPIGEDPLILEKIREYLGLELDPKADKESGYPPGLCRKCSGMLNGFDRFKKVVSQGQGHLDELAKLKRRERMGLEEKSSSGILVSYEEDSMSSESILPDLDIEIEDNVPRPMLPRPKNDRSTNRTECRAGSHNKDEEEEDGSLSSRSSMMGGSNGGVDEEEEEEDDDIDPDFDPLNFLQVSDVVGDYEEEEESNGKEHNGKEEDHLHPPSGNGGGGGEEEDNNREEEEGSEKSTDDIQIANAIYESLMDQSAEESNGAATPSGGEEDPPPSTEEAAKPDGEKKKEDESPSKEEDLLQRPSIIMDNGEDEESKEAAPQASSTNRCLIDEEEKFIESEMNEEASSAAADPPLKATTFEEEEEDPFPEPPTHVEEEGDEPPPTAAISLPASEGDDNIII